MAFAGKGGFGGLLAYGKYLTKTNWRYASGSIRRHCLRDGWMGTACMASDGKRGLQRHCLSDSGWRESKESYMDVVRDWAELRCLARLRTTCLLVQTAN